MWLETLIRELQDNAEKSDEVYLSTYSCGKTHEEPLTLNRLRFEEGKVVIDAEDN